MNNALLYFGGLVILALSALFAVPYFVDWNSYRGVFEEEATRILGREVRVGGNVNLRLLPAPYVSFEKLKIADAGDEGGESFFRAESFTMWLSVPPLLKGVLEARKVELRRPMVKLVASEDGGGNWQSLSLSPGLMPFVPKEVALQSVSLVDGVVTFGSATEGELTRIDGITGELAAEQLFGPYRFAGTINWQGQPRSVRFASSEQDASGDVRFKSSIRALASGNSYVISGKISDIKGKPRIEGDLTALVRLSLAPHAPGEEPPVAVAEPVPPPLPPAPTASNTPLAPELPADMPERPALLPQMAAKGAAPFELRAKLAGDVKGLELADVNLSLEQEGAPQLISGTARLGWVGKPRLDLTLASHWLDVDRIASADGTKAVPLEAAKGFFDAMINNLPEEADTNVSLDLEQVTLGGEALSGLRFSAARAGGPLELKSFRAHLPGGARLDLEGVIETAQKARSFDGLLSVSGPHLSRSLDWALKGSKVLEGNAEGSFALEGRLKLSSASVELSEASAELAGMPLAGDVKVGFGKRKTIKVAVEGHRVDLGALWPGSLEPAHLAELADLTSTMSDATEAEAAAPAKLPAEVATQPAADGAGKRWPGAADTDIALRLRAVELVDGERRLSDVDADVALVNGALSLPVLRFTTPSGLKVDLEGEAQDVGAHSRGLIKGTMEAKTADAAGELALFTGLAGSVAEGSRRLEPLVPFRVAGTFDIGRRFAASADLRFDGATKGGRIVGEALLDGGWRGWRTAPADITVSLTSPTAGEALAGLLGAPPSKRSGVAAGAEDGRVLVRAAGTAEKGLVTVATVDAGGEQVTYEGRIYHSAADGLRLKGSVTVHSGDALALMEAAGVRLGAAAAVPVQGLVGLIAGGDSVDLDLVQTTIGGSKVSGRITVSGRSTELPTVAADLDVDAATVPGLLNVMLVRAEPPPPAPVLASKSRPDQRARRDESEAPPPEVIPDEVWPEQGFDEAFFKITGNAKVRFGTLGLEPGLPMRDAVLEATLAPGRLEVTRLVGRALSGRVLSALAIEKAPAGVTLTGRVALDVGASGPGPDLAADVKGDVARFRLDMQGRALGPAALVTSLSGKGTLEIGDVSLTGNTPKAVAAVAEAALEGRGAKEGDDLAAAFKAALKEGSLQLAATPVGVTLADGNLSLDSVKVETPDGNSTFKTVVELATLRIDTEWQIEPKVNRMAAVAALGKPDAMAASVAHERVLLPALSVSYTGKLRDMGNLEPIVATAGLERELSVRKMERDVDELERLRRQDQARAKADLERQKALEAERAKAWQPEGIEDVPDGPAAAPAAPRPGPQGSAWPPAAVPPAPGSADVPPAEATAAVDDPDAQPADPGGQARPYRPAKKKAAPQPWNPFQLQPF